MTLRAFTKLMGQIDETRRVSDMSLLEQTQSNIIDKLLKLLAPYYVPSGLEKGTPLIDVCCSLCGGKVTIFTGSTEGALAKGRCANEVENGAICGSWFTVGKNATYLLKKKFLNKGKDNDTEENQQTGTPITAQENTEAGDSGNTGDGSTGADTGSTDTGSTDTGSESASRRFFGRRN